MQGKSTTTLVFSILFLALVFASLFLLINPLQKAAELKDKKLTEDSQQISQAIDAYQKQLGKLPWADDLGSDNAYTALPWTRSDRIEVGVCKDATCASGGDLIEAGVLDKSLLSVTIFKPFSLLYVGKAPGAKDSVKVCFVPGSEKERKNVANLYRLNLGQNPIPVHLTLCDENVRWEGEDVCWKCSGS